MGLGKRGFHRKLRQLSQFVWTDGVARFYMSFTTAVGLIANRLVATDGDKNLVSTSISNWLKGTTNQVIITDDGDGTATASTPQDIHTGANPTFAGMTLTDILDMTDNPITDVGYIDFNLTNGVPPAEGRQVWNDDEGVINTGLKGGNVNLQNGLELLIRGKNTTGTGTTDGRPVRISGASGNSPEFGFSEADDPIAMESIGVFTEDVNTNGNGYVTTNGLVRDIDTSGTPVGEVWGDNERLFVSNTSGRLTNVLPVGTERKIFIGIVIKANDTTGIIWINPINIFFIEELSGNSDGNGNPVISIDASVPSLSFGGLNSYTVPLSDGQEDQILVTSGAGVLDFKTLGLPPQLMSLDMYDAEPSRASETNWHGGLLSLATGQPLDPGPTDLPVTKGIGKVMIVVNAGSDLVGDIIITGDTVDRNTGAVTVADTDIIPVDALTVDGTTTDANGNTVHTFTGAYISSKWFEGSVVLSTTDLTLTDVDVYHISFEQLNDSPGILLKTFDANIFTTHVNAEFDAYLFIIHVNGSKCDIDNHADLHVGAVGMTAIANRYERLRRGNINDPIDGTTDGFWVDMHYSNSPAYVEDVTITVWFEIDQGVVLTTGGKWFSKNWFSTRWFSKNWFSRTS
jgi:hypothetical protein